MAGPNHLTPALPQADVFYTETWTKTVDTRFIQLLRLEKEAGHFDPSRRNVVTVRRVLRVLNLEFNTDFDYNFCADRLRELQRRYKTFYYISKYKGITYDLESGTIDADQALWEQICKNKRLAMAYATQGESEFESLRVIFQQEDDSVGWHQLEDIQQISSDFSDISVTEPVKIPRDIIQVSSDSSFWRYVGGNGFGTSSVGGSSAQQTPTSSQLTEANSAFNKDSGKAAAQKIKVAGNASPKSHGTGDLGDI